MAVGRFGRRAEALRRTSGTAIGKIKEHIYKKTIRIEIKDGWLANLCLRHCGRQESTANGDSANMKRLIDAVAEGDDRQRKPPRTPRQELRRLDSQGELPEGRLLGGGESQFDP